MVRQRPVLSGGLRAVLDRHAQASQFEHEAWAEAMLRLANVNAGPGALLAAFRVCALIPARPGALARSAAALAAATDVCRAAGAHAVRAVLDARADLAQRFTALPDGDEAAWWRGMVRIAREAPTCIDAAAGTSGRIVATCGTGNFEAFVAAGLRAVADPARRLAFFALEDPEARRVLDRLSGQITFSTMQRRLSAYAAALWGQAPPMREAAVVGEGSPERRTTISSGIVRVPDVFRTVPPGRVPALYRATVAHATAHLALGEPRFDPAKLKPVQIVLVGLIEDARIEALAMRRFPGLFHLWAPFHTAEPSTLKTVPILLERLARALFDPAYEDHDGLVSKGRTLFRAEADLSDPGLSRRIGSLLGNDIGQMRIQFNAKLHVVDPVYRDDNLGLWTLPPPPPDAAVEQLDLAVESARIERETTPDGETPDRNDPEPELDDSLGLARAVKPDDRGVVVAHYSEWDAGAGLERPDWTTIREVEPTPASTHALDAALARDPGLRMRVERLVRAARVGRPTRLRRQPDGLDLDLDAAIDAAKALRTGEIPDERIHERKVMRTRDLAVLVLIDVSESTRDLVPAAGVSIIDIEKCAVAVLAEAMDALGDMCALRAFSSDGREDVRVTRVKDFDQRFDQVARARLSGLQPQLSTRIGAALRHAGAELDPRAATRRIVIALTDGAPSDIDVPNPTDLVDDARRAVLSLRSRGIDVFGITLDPSDQGSGADVFGRTNHMPVRRIEDLPSRLSELYFRVARR
ncbi:VWA domain-containing protein [Lichenihabitans sp. Uapishka_5]|uniref:nitric oxide reductase activation protein NorD n=1 Tax=Lichenihabitans sp. Uapishka_5 TaxID=3037302 RepID=UPI0029E819DB|nr:VWA domain-containing protein [Lichenihabitans sp. Uapishka_5]MDX7950797.1 VWA domain-containing protein [Lichenihabitans sp. Uapishka_5]